MIFEDILCFIILFYNPLKNLVFIFRGVAQFGSAHGWGSCGRRFESSHPDFE